MQVEYDPGWRLIDAMYSLTTLVWPKLAVVSCGACGEDFVARDHGGRTEALWPLSVPPLPEHLPPKIAEAYQDARLALAADARIGALMAGRTALIRVLRNKEASTFRQLVERGIITQALYGGADQLRLWANIVGHEDVEVETLEHEEVTTVLDYLGIVLEAIYTHQGTVNLLVAKTEELKDKGKKK